MGLKGIKHQPDRTGGVRYRFTGTVRPETGGNRTNSNFKLNSLVQAVEPVYRPVPGRLTQKTRISGEFDVFSNLN
jgi:hypothetical protein